MGNAYSEDKLDLEATRYIEEQTKEDLEQLQKIDYCNELLLAVADILEAVAWPPQFDFKGRVFTPNERTFKILARYYVQVAQMFGAATRAGLPRSEITDSCRLVDLREGCALEDLQHNYQVRLKQREELVEDCHLRVEFPQFGELERSASELKDKLKELAGRVAPLDLEIQHRAEVVAARLHFDFLCARIEHLEQN
jgi:hypothetical protein